MVIKYLSWFMMLSVCIGVSSIQAELKGCKRFVNKTNENISITIEPTSVGCINFASLCASTNQAAMSCDTSKYTPEYCGELANDARACTSDYATYCSGQNYSSVAVLRGQTSRWVPYSASPLSQDVINYWGVATDNNRAYVNALRISASPIGTTGFTEITAAKNNLLNTNTTLVITGTPGNYAITSASNEPAGC